MKDLTQSVDLSNYYTKSEVDDKYSSGTSFKLIARGSRRASGSASEDKVATSTISLPSSLYLKNSYNAVRFNGSARIDYRISTTVLFYLWLDNSQYSDFNDIRGYYLLIDDFQTNRTVSFNEIIYTDFDYVAGTYVHVDVTTYETTITSFNVTVTAYSTNSLYTL